MRAVYMMGSVLAGPNVSASPSSSLSYPPHPQPAGRSASRRRRRVNFSPLQSAPALTSRVSALILLLLLPGSLLLLLLLLKAQAHGDLPAPARWRRPAHPRQGEASTRLQLATAGRFPIHSIPSDWLLSHLIPSNGRLMGRSTQLSANVGVGVQLHKGDHLTYNLRAKKALPFTSNGLLGLNLKGRLLTDTEFKPRKRTGAVELAWTILDFRKGQDVRLKLGYELYDKLVLMPRVGQSHSPACASVGLPFAYKSKQLLLSSFPEPAEGAQMKQIIITPMRTPAILRRSSSTANDPAAAGEQQQQQAISVDSDTVVILASLLCALICVAGLALVARCTCRRRRPRRSSSISSGSPTAAQVQPPRGLKKAAIELLPTVSVSSVVVSLEGRGGDEEEERGECAICLAVFAEGDELRVLPHCAHGFHAACIDTWLAAHASCPSCRATVVTCRRCGAACCDQLAAVAPPPPPAAAVDAATAHR
ncbi:RING-H2 finger protein ATL80 [Dichanthelium oligosanthes]|uniref:RING-H2 finger protein ATL80 n=1 Tax=Dichanthelium oligosanthes TaxID=888268 RepID=A0A1E5V9G3_9POAL|nr:RING-H2 finger protein ATL80 [Dichanthelium oligosanthes]